ncbi:hypothetical protein [Christiangramia sabulilitoris]|uniref:Uncharacterized protein n=1 Tax=Christiangramia sabulilitoris TaxID=2583991 RepID=A0A550I3E0_9FLAO|nr:hypothetical protein [Christiangramia sabulilitoris]TRO65486.1 hypothetical protein FGM01_08795 [Christiangramia sabulilitoris]
MSLNHYIGNTLIKNQRSQPANTLGGIEIDYYFMASKFGGSQTEISLNLWTVLVDCDGFIYCMKTIHIGHFSTWKEVIKNRIKDHLVKIGIDSLIIKRLIRDIEIKKEGHIIPKDIRCGGDRIGIDGSDEVYIRRSKFTYLK